MRFNYWKLVSVMTLLLVAVANAGAAAEDGPIQPTWTLEDAVREMRESFHGGTVPAEEMTGQVREFHMYATEIDHKITDGIVVKAWAFGLEGEPATVPGPELRVQKGDLVRIHLRNDHDQPHSLHPHGITSVDVLNDGVPHTSGAYIMPGQTLTYEFVAAHAGTHAYHCHVQTVLHQDMGMYGALIVEDPEVAQVWDYEYVNVIDEWDTKRDPSDAKERPTYDYFLVNGKSGHAVGDMIVPDGDIARMRFINMGFESHSLHLHGTHFVVTHKDGKQLPLPYRGDTLPIAPGETYDLLVKGRDGVFPWHDHNSLAVTDAGKYPGGMIMHVVGSPTQAFNPEYDPPRYPIEGPVHDGSKIHNLMRRGEDPFQAEGVQQPAETLAAPRWNTDHLPDMEPPVIESGHAVTEGLPPVVPFDPVAPPRSEPGEVVEVTLEATRAQMEIAPGDVREVWTFNGSIPGPTLRVTQGDTVRFTLINRDPENAHGLDFHAGRMDPGTYHQSVEPGESITFEWKAESPGVFFYHCSADPVLMHVAAGMFGTVIVDPPDYEPADREYVLVQNEWYASLAIPELLEGRPVASALNGQPFQYLDDPLTAVAGEKVRIYFVNAGPNEFSAFHIIGAIFDRVYVDGHPLNELEGVQTTTIPPGGASVVELVMQEPGQYPILTHQLQHASKGALGILSVSE